MFLSKFSRIAGGAAKKSLPNKTFAVSSRSISTSIPNRYGTTPASPFLYTVSFDKPWSPESMIEFEVMPRDEFGVPAHIPPELAGVIQHTYAVPPEFYPFLKRLGEASPEMKPYMDRLINGQMTYYEYEEMFYKFCQPVKIYRSEMALPYRTDDEMKPERAEKVEWESAWHAYRGKVMGESLMNRWGRDYFVSALFGLAMCYLFARHQWFYRQDMKEFYIHAPEHKINWVLPRGDL